MRSTVKRTPKSGRQSLFYQDMASPITGRRSGSKASTPGQVAAASALWRENFATLDLPPPPAFTLEDRSDFSPDSGMQDCLVSPEVRSDSRAPFQDLSTPKSKSEATTSNVMMNGGQSQYRHSPVGSLNLWSPAKGGGSGSGEIDDRGKDSGSPVDGVVPPGALITFPSPREVMRPEMQRDMVLVGPLDEEEWVTVYGFLPVDTNVVLREFEKCGIILKHVPGPSSGNWMNILYQNRADAQKALSKNGVQINGALMIGVKPVDPIQRQALNKKLNRQGFMPLPPPSTTSSNLNSSRSSYSQPNIGINSVRQSSGSIATPAKSLASKVMDVMFGF